MELEYVGKAETKLARRLMNNCFKQLKSELKKKKIIFSVEMVGSVKRNLVLRPIHKQNVPKQLFDVDYNVLIHKTGKMKAADVSTYFKKQLTKIMLQKKFTLQNSSKKALKFYSTDKSTGKWSYEMAIFVKNKNDFKLVNLNRGVLITEKQYTSPVVNERYISKEGLVCALRIEYKRLKQKHFEDGRESFEIYLEAINNIITNEAKIKAEIEAKAKEKAEAKAKAEEKKNQKRNQRPIKYW
jgi:replicative DNA helicase